MYFGWDLGGTQGKQDKLFYIYKATIVAFLKGDYTGSLCSGTFYQDSMSAQTFRSEYQKINTFCISWKIKIQIKVLEPELLSSHDFIIYYGLHEQFSYSSLIPKSNMTSEKLI